MNSTNDAAAPRRALPPEPRNWRRIVALVVGSLMIASGLGVGTWVYKYGGIIGSGAAVATSPELAVHGYLTAIAASNATEALSYASAQPADSSYLTGEVLASSRANHPMSRIVVNPTTTKSVTARFHLGDKPTEANFETVQVGLIYKVINVATEVKVSGQTGVIPLLISNQPVTATAVQLFPGIYDVSTPTKHMGYQEKRLEVLEAGGQKQLKLTPIITESGQKAVNAAAKAQLQKCLASKTVTPDGCLVQFDPPAGVNLKPDGVAYSLVGDDPTGELKVAWDGSKPGVLKLPISLDIRVLATSVDDKTFTATEHFKFANVDLAKDPMLVSFTRE